ncbi:MAG: ABC transporter ATP-binding protein [Acidimicrobiia bacterium]|nr:ABC transporter ATP-binding protein [Acidimicrobiia bacterium]
MIRLSLTEVTVRYDQRAVVDAVSMDLSDGEWLSIIGPNGAGKSTLLATVVGLVGHTGTVTVDGQTTLRRRTLARRIAYVPQTPQRPPGMRVFDYVLLGRTPHLSFLGVESHHDLEMTAEALALLDLTDLAGRDVASLSGGEAQRVVLARAIAQEAPILLLDEPTTALDIGRQQDVLSLIDDLRRVRSLTVLTTMHDLTLAGQFADRLVLLDGGAVVAEGVPTDVLTPELIRRHYAADVRVLEDGDGSLTVIPLRRGPHRSPTNLPE